MEKEGKPVETNRFDLRSFSPFNGFHGQTMRIALWPMEAWLQWQAEILRITAPTAAEWMQHRREGTEAALQALQRLCTCEDAEEAAKIHSEWLAEETKRLEADIRSLSASAPSWLQSVVGYPGTWLSAERSGGSRRGERAR